MEFGTFILAYHRFVENFCVLFEDKGLYRLEIQRDPEPYLLERTTLVTMFRKPLAIVEIVFEPENECFKITGRLAPDYEQYFDVVKSWAGGDSECGKH